MKNLSMTFTCNNPSKRNFIRYLMTAAVKKLEPECLAWTTKNQNKVRSSLLPHTKYIFFIFWARLLNETMVSFFCASSFHVYGTLEKKLKNKELQRGNKIVKHHQEPEWLDGVQIELSSEIFYTCILWLHLIESFETSVLLAEVFRFYGQLELAKNHLKNSFFF